MSYYSLGCWEVYSYINWGFSLIRLTSFQAFAFKDAKPITPPCSALVCRVVIPFLRKLPMWSSRRWKSVT